MDNNRNRRATNFENDLQNLLSDYLTRNLNNTFNNREDTGEDNNDNAEHIFDTYRQSHNSNPYYNSSFSENHEYLRTINRIIDTMDRTMTTYQNNMTLYLNIMNRTIINLNNRETNRNQFRNTINIPYRNTSPNVFNHIPRTNPLRPSQNIRTNVSQPVRYDHVLTYTLPYNRNNIFGPNTEELFSNLFQNVVVRPTPEQIDNASEHIVYDSSMNLINQRCPITLEEFEVGNNLIRLNHCGHTFMENSFTNWFQSNVRCPVCRHDIRENNDNQPTTVNEDNNIEEVNNDTDSEDANLSTNTDNSMNTNFQLFSDTSNINLFDLINTNIQTLLDPSSNTGFRLEIPIQYSEIYDMSDNFIGRTFP